MFLLSEFLLSSLQVNLHIHAIHTRRDVYGIEDLSCIDFAEEFSDAITE